MKRQNSRAFQSGAALPEYLILIVFALLVLQLCLRPFGGTMVASYQKANNQIQVALGGGTGCIVRGGIDVPNCNNGDDDDDGGGPKTGRP